MSILIPSSDINDTSNISFSLFHQHFLSRFLGEKCPLTKLELEYWNVLFLHACPIWPTYKCHATIVASSIIFTVSFLISVHPSLLCLVVLRLYFELLLQQLIGQWYLFVSGLYCGSKVDDLLVTGACLNFFSCLLRFWIKVNVLLHVTSRHLKIPFLCLLKPLI